MSKAHLNYSRNEDKVKIEASLTEADVFEILKYIYEQDEYKFKTFLLVNNIMVDGENE